MSKRICLSLLSAPNRSHQVLPQCSALIPNIARGSPPLQCFRRRQQAFSTTPQRRVGGSRMVTGGKKTQPSMSIQMKAQQAQAMRDGTLLDMIGLMDNTYVPPTGKNLPSYFSNWSERWKFQRYRIMSFVEELKAYFIAKTMVRPRVKLEKGKIPGITKELYEDMYNHFAAGTLHKIETKLAPGLLSNLRNRIAARPPNTALLWTLHKYYGQPETVSYKFTVFPDGAKNQKMGIAQAVVKIKSKQSLQHVQRLRVKETRSGVPPTRIEEIVVDEQGKAVPAHRLEEHREKNAKVTTEYVVVQQLMKKSKFGPWHIWGTTEESSIAKMKRQEKEFAAKMKAQQRMKDGK